MADITAVAGHTSLNELIQPADDQLRQIDPAFYIRFCLRYKLHQQITSGIIYRHAQRTGNGRDLEGSGAGISGCASP